MIKTLQKSAKTEDEAVRLALAELGLERDDVSVTIIERAKSGFLGIGSTAATVEVSYSAPDEPAPKPKAALHPEPVAAAKPEPKAALRPEPAAAAKPEPKAALRSETETAEESEVSVAEDAVRARDFLAGLLERFGAEAGVTDGEITDHGIAFTLNSKDPGALIGRRGETLEAVQSITNYVVNRGSHRRMRIIVDAENYRSRRGDTLESLAQKTAEKAIKYLRSVTLEPMNAYERHVIHSALQEFPGVSTHSVGTEPNRAVVVTPDGVSPSGEPRGEFRRGGSNRGNGGSRPPRSGIPRRDFTPPRRDSSSPRPEPAVRPEPEPATENEQESE
ncbi:MAG: protein jag [Oscillospiraceae bacterium]|jgi:spoIIIJ-associated protein|nr:protein jag [Oscillospiraceae bacterium]